MQKRHVRYPRAAMATTPAITPPTIAPMLGPLFEDDCVEPLDEADEPVPVVDIHVIVTQDVQV